MKGCQRNYRLPRWLSGKESTCNAGAVGLIPGPGRSSGEGNGNPFQYSVLGKPMDRGTRRSYNLGSPRVRHDLTTKHLHHRQRNEGVKESQIMPNRRQGKENRNSWHGQERMRKSPHSTFRLSLRSPGWRCASQWLGLNMCGSVLSDSL